MIKRIRIIITIRLRIRIMMKTIITTRIRRTEGTEEQGVSEPKHPSLLAS